MNVLFIAAGYASIAAAGAAVVVACGLLLTWLEDGMAAR